MPEAYGATTTAAEVVRGVDLTGKAAVVTGAAFGIGVETARARPIWTERCGSRSSTSRT